MATSGTYAFALGYDDVFDESFERCGVDPATLTPRHMMSATRSANLLMSEWSAKRFTFFDVDEQTQLLTANDLDYTASLGTIMILEANIRRNGVDTPVFPISREMYFNISKKDQAGLPSNVWYDISRNMYFLWTAPENSTDTFIYKRLRRKQDVVAMSENPDVNYVYYEAVCAGMAKHLSLKFAIDRFDKLKALADEAFNIAQLADRERTDVSFDMSL